MTSYGELGTGCYLLKNLLIKTVLMKDFPVIIQDYYNYHILRSFKNSMVSAKICGLR